ncbi:MAG: RNA-binding domain-containing protein [Nanoarchaeota archaeon]
MKYAHNVKISVFSHENENKESNFNAFLELFPFNLEKSKVKVEKTNAEGVSENKIEILEVNLDRQKLVNDLLFSLVSKIKDVDKSMIISQLESRLDSGLHFFLRIDKETWINERKIMITDSGSCFHMRISVAAFPKKREIALKLMKELFSKEI